MTDVSPITQGEQPTGTVGFTKKVSTSDYGTGSSEEFAVFIQFPVTFGDEEATVLAAQDAAFQAKSIVLAQLGIQGKVDDGVLRPALSAVEQVKAVFPGTTEVVSQSPLQAQIAADQAYEDRRSTAAPAAPNGNPVCPTCQSPLWDNRPKNAERVAAGQKPLPEGRCKNYADPPKGTGCTGVVWNWAKGV